LRFRISAKVYLASVTIAVAFGGLVLPALAQSIGAGTPVPAISQGPFVPRQILMNNTNTEVSATTTKVLVGELTYTFSTRHHLVITFSAVGAVSKGPNSATPAILFLGCYVDGKPCVGSQNNPTTTPAGWVNTLSTDYSTTGPAAWDNWVGYTWFTTALPAGTHTVVIWVETGNALFGFMGAGTAFCEARNLVVTITT